MNQMPQAAAVANVQATDQLEAIGSVGTALRTIELNL